MESLPKQFVAAMQTLFDIMDDKQTGYVRLTDIEHRWRDDRTKGLPPGVIESLQKVASHDGLLTFDRFCTGLKICLLRNQVEIETNKTDIMSNELHTSAVSHTHKALRPPSAPILDINDTRNRDRSWNNVHPESTSQYRTVSMPQLLARKDNQVTEIRIHPAPPPPQKQDPMRLYGHGPPKPPRLEKSSAEMKDVNKCKLEDVFNSDRIEDSKSEELLRNIEKSRGLGDGRPAGTESSKQQAGVRRPARRREPRRHTLHNGVDYNLLKRMKQIEQEKDVLFQGLTAVEDAREWYLQQLAEVQDKMRYAGRMGAYVEPWNEAQQERLELLRARVLELNRQLSALAAGWRHGQLSLHMNLALPSGAGVPRADPAVLKTQNRMLAEEVNRKNEKISNLEKEKSSLIRELVMQRNRSKMIDNFS